MNRRHAIRCFTTLMAGSPVVRTGIARAQEPPPLPERLPRLEDLVNVFEFEPVARRNMTKNAYDFIALGVDDEWSLQRNRDGFKKITFRPRMMVDVSNLDLSTDLFGSKIGMPILIAPTAGHQQAHPEGELATMRAAGAAKTIMVVSTNSSYPIAKIGEAAAGPFWFQLYAAPDPEDTRGRVENALAAGAKLICLTVDTQYNSNRERLFRNRIAGGVLPGVAPPPTRGRTARQPPNAYRISPGQSASLTWPFVKVLKSWTKTPVIVKGLLTAEDALLAIEHGADGIVVSNHGGRYLDGVPSTIEVLPEIVAAVKGRVPVLVDGGIRRGTDILKALAIGAKAVLVGRPPLWGLGAYGQAGVLRVMQMLESELAIAMGLSGAPNLAAISPKLLRIDR